MNCKVVALDKDEKRISCGRALSRSNAAQIAWAVADAESPLPLKFDYFDAVIVVHYVSKRIIEIAHHLLKTGGYLIFETFDSRGENWRGLPNVGAVSAALKNGFETILLRERTVGPNGSRAVVKALARKTEAFIH
jgi:SAM-dependent methyltransferase